MTVAQKNIKMRKPGAGMARAVSQSNRERYRKSASGTIGKAEENQLLEDLAEEIDPFKREARCRLSPVADNGRVSISRDPRRIE